MPRGGGARNAAFVLADQLEGIDFAKGCYVGQEVTARSKHRATLHKYIHCVSADAPLPPSGTVITSDGRELGDMRSSSGTTGLASTTSRRRTLACRRAHR